jgi:AhpC/TSA family
MVLWRADDASWLGDFKWPRALGAKLEPLKQPQEWTPMRALKPGMIAPSFSLPSSPNDRVSLSDILGHPEILVFYPADWSPVCSDQLALYNELREEFSEFDADFR